MATLKQSLFCGFLAIALLPGCAGGPHANNTVQMMDPQALAGQLGLSVARNDNRMIILSGSRGTIVFNALADGVMVNRIVRFGYYRPVLQNGRVSVPAGFVEECGRYLKPASAVATLPTPLPPVPIVVKASGRVVIDAGHGGKDPGAIGIGGSHEKTVNLRIAQLVASKLEAAGLDVTMTRSGDSFIELEDRPAIANRMNADAFVAIHADSVENTSVSGFSVYVVADKYSEQERALEVAGSTSLRGAALIHALSANRTRSMRLAQLVRTQLAQVSDDRGIKQGAYRVLKQSVSPAILIETGFMSNPTEEQQLNNATYQDALATSISNGIIAFLAGK